MRRFTARSGSRRPQHLDPAAYRRDRRKDQFLQENGYLILRFLAEDVASDLDVVPDGILRSLSHCQRAPEPGNRSIGQAIPGDAGYPPSGK